MFEIDLQGFVAIVVGGSRGIGGAITRELAGAGATVVFTHTGGVNTGQALSLEEKINAKGLNARGVAVDATDAKATRKLVDSVVQSYGRVDGLVFNVGRNTPIDAVDLTEDSWQRHMDLNLTSAFYAAKSVLPHMCHAEHGRIILIGSSAVYDGGGGALDYAAAKAGLDGMMAYLCRTYLRRGIVTNVIHPCVIETDLLKGRYSGPEQRKKLVDQIPVGRLGRPEDIAGLVVFLFSSWGEYICGQKILADGGRTLYNK